MKVNICTIRQLQIEEEKKNTEDRIKILATLADRITDNLDNIFNSNEKTTLNVSCVQTRCQSQFNNNKC